MAVVTYCLLVTSTGVCTDKFQWDDTYTYTPASGYSLAPNDAGEVGWTWNGSVWSYTSSTPAAGTLQPYSPSQYLDYLTGSYAAGDLIYYDSATYANLYRLPAGSSGQVLTISGGLPTWAAASSGVNKPVLLFLPSSFEPTTTNYATYAVRNLHPVLNFDTATQESAVWTAVLPLSYSNGGLTVDVYYAAATATTGTIGWDVAIERIDASSLDIDADSFATAQVITAATVPGTSGMILKSSVSITNGANMDSLVAGEAFRIKLRRNVAVDTAAGDAQLVAMIARET